MLNVRRKPTAKPTPNKTLSDRAPRQASDHQTALYYSHANAPKEVVRDVAYSALHHSTNGQFDARILAFERNDRAAARRYSGVSFCRSEALYRGGAPVTTNAVRVHGRSATLSATFLSSRDDDALMKRGLAPTFAARWRSRSIFLYWLLAPSRAGAIETAREAIERRHSHPSEARWRPRSNAVV
jgi:hypothetical protein